MRLLTLLVWSSVLAGTTVAQTPDLAWLRQMVPGDHDFTEAVAFGDANRDGAVDLFVANGSGSPSRLYLNTGHGRFVEAVGQFPADLTAGSDAIWVDIDGDRDQDLFVAVRGAGDRLFRNDPTGLTEVTATNLPRIVAAKSEGAAADVDGDGDMDLLVGVSEIFTQRAPILYLNDGSGKFTDGSANLPSQALQVFALAMGDVDGDGDADVVFALAVGQNLLYLNDGNGVFAPAPPDRLPAVRDATQDILLGDVDGDRDLDLIAVNGGTGGSPTGQIRLHLNDGSGRFTDQTATKMPARVEQHVSGALLDADGDGDLDLMLGMLANFSRGQAELYLNDGTGGFSPAPPGAMPELQASTVSIAVADVDGDGDQDAWLGNDWKNSVHGQDVLLLNDGRGVFADATAPTLPGDSDSTFGVAIADFDGDGDLDVFANNAGFRIVTTGQNRLYLNEGSGAFVEVTATHLPTDTDFGLGVSSGDVDGDGDVDLLIGNQQRTARLYLNDGSARFTQAPFPFSTGNSFATALFDADGDGDLDAFLAIADTGSFGSANRLYINDGRGTFTDESTARLPAHNDFTQSVAVGDLDGDGDLDLLVGNSATIRNPASLRIYRNDGRGVFADASADISPVFRIWSEDVALGDIDGDGDLDAVVVASRNAQTDGLTRIYVNDGTGRLRYDSQRFPQTFFDGQSLELADMDDDGDLDLVISATGLRAQAVGIRVFANDGRGFFAFEKNLGPAASETTLALAIADLDGDRDLDVFLGNVPARNRVLTNLRRQLAWREIPRIGKDLILDVYGKPSGMFAVCFTTARGRTPTPWGELQIDLTTSILDVQGLLDGDGRAEVRVPIPAVPALIGERGYWQGLIDPDAQVSNLEIVTIRGY